MTYRLLKRLLHDPLRFVGSCVKRLGFLFPDKLYLSLLYRLEMGKWIDWRNPKTFTEKLQWLKLHDFKPEYTKMVDKYAVKDYVASIIGDEYIIPTLGVWDRVEDIDWDSLPDQFVLKTTHGGGGVGVVICQDKSKFDRRAAEKKLSASMRTNAGKTYREKPYLKVPRRIIAEKYMAGSSRPIAGGLVDYKFYCFNGVPELVMVADGRNSGDKRFGYYDLDWNPVKITWGAPRPEVEFEKPSTLDEMLRIASELSKDLVHARIDLYNIEDKVYFGEITFFDGSGLAPIEPEDYDSYLGGLMKLPESIVGGVMCRVSGNYVECTANTELKDYKFFCFKGKVKCFKIDYDRFKDHHINYYTPEGELLPFGEAAYKTDYDHHEIMPPNLDDMVHIAERLSAGLKFIRVDLYNISGKIYFGELTFYPAGGFEEFTPEEWNDRLGGLIDLTASSGNGSGVVS